MPKRDHSSNSQFTHQLFHGTTWHSRLLPSVHKFTYPYRYWGVNISALAAGDGLPEVASMQLQNNHTHSAKLFNKLPFGAAIIKGLPIFSAKHKALQQFYADDYLQGLPLDQANQEIATDANVDTSADANVKSIEGLLQRLNAVFKDKTGSTPTGEIIGLIVCRNVGIYFSPVNFYIGFDSEQTPTHLLAEVSNTPWDKRHYYGFLLKGAETELCHDKDFHVSPFNPIDQLYRWQVSIKPQPSKSNKANKNDVFDIRIAINISDKRGEVLKTGIKMSGEPMTQESIRQSLKQNPLMNFTSLTRIYWHAFKLYAFKKVPYINYDEKLADSEQSVNN